MARPLPRRRSRDDDAPDADEYDSKSKRSSREEEDEDERRPRRGRGEPAEETTSRRRSEPEEPQVPELPDSKRALARLDDDAFADLVTALDLPSNADEDDVWEEIEKIKAEEEKPPRGRGRGRAAEEEEEKPSRGRRRSSSGDEDEEKPSRGRRRSSSEDEDEDDKPSRGRGRSRGRDDDGEDEVEIDTTRKAKRGFEGFKKTRQETANFDDFKLTDEEVLVKFLEDEPFATYGEHGLYKELNKGQRVWICLKPEDCPICNTGHNARAVALWNVLVIPEKGDPKVKVLKAGPALEELLEKKGSLKTGPLSKEYYSLSQTPGKNDGPVQYAVELVRERDLGDWDVEPFTKSELKDYEQDMEDEDYVKFPTFKAAKEIAGRLRDRD